MGGPEKKMKMELQEDRISQLPDDIKILILCLLPSKQFVRTSVLAKSWRNLWKPLVKQVFVVFPGFHYYFLKNMSIAYKNAQGFNVQDILTNCPLLEHLRLVRSISVTNLKVYTKLLKNLEIKGCCNLRKMEFNAPKLVSFKYDGPDTKFVFLDVPSLVELSLANFYGKFVIQHKFKQFEPILHQLETINLFQAFTCIDEFPKIDGLRNIKKVRLDIRVWDYQRCLRLLKSMHQALPSLGMFFLGWYLHPDRIENMEASKVEFENHHEHSLIRSTIEGSIFDGFELGIMGYMINNAVSHGNAVLRVWKIDSEDIMDSDMSEATRF